MLRTFYSGDEDSFNAPGIKKNPVKRSGGSVCNGLCSVYQGSFEDAPSYGRTGNTAASLTGTIA
ncbi:hypothetical protein A8C56_10920 [Niabella ginsenosidivorans]|uniref:Uncharacterized protein n=1 Tax=Niabella ginsenosidivorans TaxID=1176587 RepID=A0A1A9I266_9BACT|nr:hypothetical protein [Niabella ginsenosidivorans]ANH81425.1 hypothetical protein A8C56_10920 [Niabella ginsenosidivorans]